MGIPHLITFLQPYAEVESLGQQDVIIDGPAFAYHIYYTCQANRPDARGPFDAIPSYGEIEEASVRWLDSIRGSGASV